MRRILAITFTLTLFSSAFSAEPFSAEKIAKAEATFKELFGDEHLKMTKVTKVADRSKYAKKLLERAKLASNDPVLADVIRGKALPFAGTDSSGIEAATEIYRANLEFLDRKATSLEKLAELGEKALASKSVADRQASIAEVTKNYHDAIVEYEKSYNPSAAITTVAKARTFTRKWIPTNKEVFVQLDADEKRLQPKAIEQAEFEKLKLLIDKNPGDPKTRLALGLAFLRANRLADAGEHLKEAGPFWKSFAATVSAKTATPSEIMTQAYDLAVALPAEDRKAQSPLFEVVLRQGDLARNEPNANWTSLRIKYLDAHERIGSYDSVWVVNSVTAVVAEYLDQAEEALQAKRSDNATEAMTKARSAAKLAKSNEMKALLADLDVLEKAVKALIVIEQEAEKWKVLAAQGPLDAKSNLTYGIVLLRLERTTDAVPFLAKSENKSAQQLGTLLQFNGKIPPLDLANKLRTFALDLKGDDKLALLGSARHHYEEYLSSQPSPGAEKTRVELLLKDLPSSSIARPTYSGKVITLIDENPGLVDSLITNGNTKISWDSSSFSGKGCLLLNQNLNTGKLEEWTIPMIASTPEKNYRYMRFAWRTSKETEAVSLGFFFKDNGGSFTYSIGAAADGTIAVADSTSEKWTYVMRDIQHDFPKASGTVIASYFTIKGKNPAIWLDNLEFATSPKAFPPLRANKK